MKIIGAMVERTASYLPVPLNFILKVVNVGLTAYARADDDDDDEEDSDY